jgi:hypothetical protein
METTWDKVKRYLRMTVWLVPAIILVAAVAFLLILGIKVPINDLLAKMFGPSAVKKTKPTIESANSVPQGRLVPKGVPDSTGQTQAEVVPIEESGGHIKVTPPGETKPIDVVLPDGVDSGDVNQVIIVKPQVDAVEVKTTSPVTSEQVTDLLNKYGRKP